MGAFARTVGVARCFGIRDSQGFPSFVQFVRILRSHDTFSLNDLEYGRLTADKEMGRVARSPLIMAMQTQHETIAVYLLSRISREEIITSRNKAGQSLLHFASEDGLTEVVKELVFNHGCKLALDHDYHTPLCYAAMRGHVETTQFFLDNAERYGHEKEVLLEVPCPYSVPLLIEGGIIVIHLWAFEGVALCSIAL